MRDTMVSEAAVFEPEELKVLSTAYRLAMDRLGPEQADMERGPEVAKLVHNLGRSRIRLKKPLQTPKHAAEIASEAIEQLSYLDHAPESVLAAVRENGVAGRPGSRVDNGRIVGAFPNEFRQPPISRL